MKGDFGVKKCLAYLLTVVLIFTVIPFGVFDFRANAETEDYYTYYLSNDRATIEDVSEEINGDIIVPETLGGKVVKAIGDSAFKDCTALISITLPDSVTSIGRDAFENCIGLESITLGKNLRYIESHAFSGCKNLKDVYYNNSYWQKIESIITNDNAELTAATWHYAIEDNLIYSYNEADLTATVSRCAEPAINVTIPESVTKDEKSYKITGIESSAFFRCTELKSLVIGDNVISIGSAAFSGCTGLETVTIGKNVTSIGNMAFYNCTGLESIIIPKSVTSFGKNVFRYSNAICYCYKNSYAESYLKENNVPYIYIDATSNDDIVSGKITRYNWTLNKRTGVLELSGSGAIEDFTSKAPSWYDYRLFVSSVILPQGVTKIGENAFKDFVKLKNITIPNNVKTIDKSAFYSCIKLEIVDLGNGINAIKDQAFAYCENLKSITIPSGVTSIGQSVFRDCFAIETVNFNAVNCNSLDEYRNPVFENCTNLKNVNIANGVKTIPSFLFEGCIGIESVIIPYGVTSIGEDAFDGCKSLESVTLPNSLISISDGAFYYCSSLKSIAIPNSVVTIGEWAFSGCISLNDVIIGNSVTTIGNAAFNNCRSLTEITIPDSVITIGESAFDSCSRLTNINLPNSINSIGDEAFSHCDNLMSINISEKNRYYCTIDGVLFDKNITTLMQYPIARTDTSYTIPNTVTGVDDHAFSGCEKLKNITVYNPTCYFYIYCGIDKDNIIYGFKGSTAEEFAQKVGADFIDVETVHSHNFTESDTTDAKICLVCGRTECEILGHKYTNSCDSFCNNCNEYRTPPHAYKSEITSRSTTAKNGLVVTKCSACGHISKQLVIRSVKSIALSSASATYNGKIRTPGVVVKDSAGRTINSKHYTVSYQSGRKNVGRYKVTVKLKGYYSGTKNLYFTILPPKTTLSKLTSGKKSFTATITKKSTQVTGYQLQYSTNKRFTSVKTKTIKSNKSVRQTIKSLKAKKYYYVRVRTYRTVGGKHYYSGWSSYKTVKTK